MGDRFLTKYALIQRSGTIIGTLVNVNRNLPPQIQAAGKALFLLMPLFWFRVRHRMVGALAFKHTKPRNQKSLARPAGFPPDTQADKH